MFVQKGSIQIVRVAIWLTITVLCSLDQYMCISDKEFPGGKNTYSSEFPENKVLPLSSCLHFKGDLLMHSTTNLIWPCWSSPKHIT